MNRHMNFPGGYGKGDTNHRMFYDPRVSQLSFNCST